MKKALEQASKIVKSWPPWKQNLLEHSMKSTHVKPRIVTRPTDPGVRSDDFVPYKINEGIKIDITKPSWDHTFMTMAHEIAKRSHDIQTQCGAIIVNDKKHIISAGYNGFIHGIDDTQLPNTRPDKYPFMIHAELNALLNAEAPVVGATIYVTTHPCLHCYQCLLQARISTIVYNTQIDHIATMLDKDMMDKIKKIKELTNNRMTMIPYFYEES